jgi:hypothetical protein
MLVERLQRIAEVTVPAAFDKNATHLCDILRTTDTPTGYGGEDTVDAELLTDVPCVYLSIPKSARYQLGKETRLARILIPRIVEGEPLDLQLTDKIRLQESEIVPYERVFQVKDISPMSDVYLDVEVIQEEGNA